MEMPVSHISSSFGRLGALVINSEPLLAGFPRWLPGWEFSLPIDLFYLYQLGLLAMHYFVTFRDTPI